jgi:hypothetical protein
MAQPQGEAVGYYNNEPQPGYQPQQPQEVKTGFAPPTYGQDFNMTQDNKQTFEQTFKVEKPKLNDLWAGILVGGQDLIFPPDPSLTAFLSAHPCLSRICRGFRLNHRLLLDASIILRRRYLQWRK